LREQVVGRAERALQQERPRLADDHRSARLLAELLAGLPKLRVDPATVETNMVHLDHAGTGWSTVEFVARLKAAGVLVSPRPPAMVRLVTDRHHDAESIREAVRRIGRAIA